MNALKERFDPSSGSGELGDSVQVVDLAVLSPVELTEYQTLIGNLITWTDFTRTRLGYSDAQCRAILEGASDENELIRAMIQSAGSRPGRKK